MYKYRYFYSTTEPQKNKTKEKANLQRESGLRLGEGGCDGTEGLLSA